MKINSEHLYKYINELATDEKVIFNVYYDDQYVTQIYWNGDNFEWETGTFTSEAFFNPLYDFIPTEENKKIEKLDISLLEEGNNWLINPKTKCIKNIKLNSCFIDIINSNILGIQYKINEIIDYLMEKKQ